MNELALHHFRAIADQMLGNEPRNWNWRGPYISQNRIGVTEAEAKRLCATFGGKVWQDAKEGN